MIKFRRNRRNSVNQLLRAAAFAAPALLAASWLSHPAKAVDLSWDKVGSGALGGTDNWDTTNNFWWNGSTDTTWTDGSGAIFGGTAGTVTLTGPRSASGMTFNTTGYLLTSDTLTLTGASNVALGTGLSASIASVVAGSGLTLSGGGTLSLSNSNTWAGNTSIAGSTVIVGTNNGLGASTNNVSADGSVIRGAGGVTIAQPISFGANNLTLSGKVGVADPGTFSTGAGDVVTFSGALTGTSAGRLLINSPPTNISPAGGFTTVVLTNTNNSLSDPSGPPPASTVNPQTPYGNVQIAYGLLVVGASGALPSNAIIQMNQDSLTSGAASTRQLFIPAGVNQTIAELRGGITRPQNGNVGPAPGGLVTLNGSLHVGDGNNFLSSNGLSGTGSLEKLGTGLMWQQQASAGYSGPVTVTAGTLRVSANSNVLNTIGNNSATNTLTLNGGTLQIQETGSMSRAVIVNASTSSAVDLSGVSIDAGIARPVPRIGTFAGVVSGSGTMTVTNSIGYRNTSNVVDYSAGLRLTANNGGAAHGGTGAGFSGPIVIKGTGVFLISNSNSYFLGDGSATNVIRFSTGPASTNVATGVSQDIFNPLQASPQSYPDGTVVPSILGFAANTALAIPQNITIDSGAVGNIRTNNNDTSVLTLNGNISGSGTLALGGPQIYAGDPGGQPSSLRSRGTIVLAPTTGDNSGFTGQLKIVNRVLVQADTSSKLGSGTGGNSTVSFDLGGRLQPTGNFSSSRTIAVGDQQAPGGSSNGGVIEGGAFNTSWGDLVKISTSATGIFNKTNTGKVSFSRINPNNDTLDVNIVAGTLAVKDRATTGGNQVMRVRTLSISGTSVAPTSTLDLNDNDLVVNAGNFGNLQAMVLAGFRSSPDPAATGITSTTSQNNGGLTILALFDNALIGTPEWPPGSGNLISASAVVGKYTYFGDLNFDGQVTGDDYGVVDANLDTTPAPGIAWISGDANLDGIVTGDDYGVIDAALGNGTGNPLGASVRAVPEPAAALLGLALLTAARTRQRRKTS